MGSRQRIRVARVYDQMTPADGTRVLIDRVWPRGFRKDELDVAEWCKAVAPSTELRKWYGHDPQRFAEFATRYRAELRDPERSAAARHLGELAQRGTLTLVTATKDVEHSHAAVLAEILRG